MKCHRLLHLLSACWMMVLVQGTDLFASRHPWTPSTYPNPARDGKRCGRLTDISRVCDPDGILSVTGADTVEGVLKEIVVPTPPYAFAPCDWLEPGRRGFQVGVAVMREMDLQGQGAEQAAERFAGQLLKDWGVGENKCRNGALLLLSIANRQIYITAGKDRMSQAHIATTVDRMKPDLRAGKYDAAVNQAVVEIGVAFAQQAAGDTGESKELSSGVAIGLIAAVGAGILALFVRSHRRTRAERRSVRSLLDKLKQEQLHARRTGSYPATSCPICFADFPESDSVSAESSGPHASQVHSHHHQGDENAAPSAPPLPGTSTSRGHEKGDEDLLKPLVGSSRGANPLPSSSSQPPAERERKPLSLPCGHTFCESCIGRWLGDNTSCPICRRPVTGDEPRPRPPPCQRGGAELYDDEVAFRLATLSRLHPTIVTQSVLADMHSHTQHGTVVDWNAFRQSETTVAAALNHAQAGSSGAGGWAFSGGSGGGGGYSTTGGGGSW